MRYILSLILLMSFSAGSQAAVASDELAALRSELMSLLRRVEVLESENQSLKEIVEITAAESGESSEQSKASHWTDTVALKGDFRYRYENIDAQRSDTRERNRVRARLAVTAQPTDTIEIGVGLASGSDDPLSTNQTLGGGGATKDIRLDLAYFKWQPHAGVTVIGGKMSNPWYRPGGHELLWDGDLRPEGFAVSYENGNFFLNSAVHFLESDTGRSNARMSYGSQTGFAGAFGGGKLVAGVGYFDQGTAGEQVFFGGSDDFFGNTFTCVDPISATDCSYNQDYEALELFAELTTQLGEQPLMLFVDLVQNQAADKFDTGWSVGLKIGKASSPNSWEMGYVYEDLEADAVLGLQSGSDFGGGGTDVKGHIVRGTWAVNKSWKLGFTYFDNERHVDLGVSEDYRRFMFDSAFKF